MNKHEWTFLKIEEKLLHTSAVPTLPLDAQWLEFSYISGEFNRISLPSFVINSYERSSYISMCSQVVPFLITWGRIVHPLVVAEPILCAQNFRWAPW